MNALLITAALGAVVVAGLFFAFSTFVMAALDRLVPAEGIRAMQAINVAVINPWPMGLLFGTALLAIAAVIAAFTSGSPSRPAALTGALLYIVGCVGVTGTRNVPLNDRLAAVEADDPAVYELWRHYLTRWTVWNHVRTLASLGAGIAFLLAAQRS